MTCEGEIKAEIPTLPTTFTTANPTPTPVIRVQPGVHSFCDSRCVGADKHVVEEDLETGSSSADGTRCDDGPSFYESIEASYEESDGEGGCDDGKVAPEAVEPPCVEGAPHVEGAPAGDGVPDGSAPASKAVRKRTLRDCVGSHKTVCSLNESTAVVGKHFLRKQNGWRHALDRIATEKEKMMAGDRVEGG